MAARKPKTAKAETSAEQPLKTQETAPAPETPKAPAFDPDEYIKATYGVMYDIVAVQKAVLRELVILNHRG